jgi:hypothetical protein
MLFDENDLPYLFNYFDTLTEEKRIKAVLDISAQVQYTALNFKEEYKNMFPKMDKLVNVPILRILCPYASRLFRLGRVYTNDVNGISSLLFTLPQDKVAKLFYNLPESDYKRDEKLIVYNPDTIKVESLDVYDMAVTVYLACVCILLTEKYPVLSMFSSVRDLLYKVRDNIWEKKHEFV